MSDPLATLRKALHDRYALDRAAGEGGMATVYRATDVKHHRAVAIKVLKPELAATIGADRFLREIELAAGLQHPHIVPVYDSGAAEGVLYYVMPFIEGESLRDRLERDGRLPLPEAIRLAGEIASALQYAHEHGIVHRDIKPENILLSGGHAVVADFGVARAAEAPAEAPQKKKLTGFGLAIGTPAYMSPEQATASEDVDARSDQYSLAAVFYEMVSGEQPFTGPTLQAVISRSISGPRPRLAAVRPAVATEPVTAAIDAALQRALATDPTARFPDVQAFARAIAAGADAGRGGLPRWAWAAAALVLALVGGGSWWLSGRARRAVRAGAERIAVLPFAVTGGGDQLLGEGMVDLLSTNLNAVGGIRTVDPRAVLFQVKKRGGALAVDLTGALAVGKALDAGAVLIGTVVNAGPQVRLSAQLYDRNGNPLGQPAQVNGPADSVLGLVDSLSVRLVRDVWLSREPVPSLHVSALTTGSIAAMRDYLTGEQFYRRSQWDSAQAAFGRAVAADSTFALAQYRLAMTYGWTGGFGQPQADSAIATAQRFASRLPVRERTLLTAYQLFEQRDPRAADTLQAYLGRHPDDADAWYLLGEVQFHGSSMTPRSPAELEAPFERVLTLDPSLTPALIHPIQIALAGRDTATFARYLSLLQAGGATDEATAFRTAADLLRGRHPSDSAIVALFRQHADAAAYGLFATFNDPTASSDSIAAEVRAFPNPFPAGSPPASDFELGRIGMIEGMGRLAAGYAEGRALARTAPDFAIVARIFPALFGIAPEPDAMGALGDLERLPHAPGAADRNVVRDYAHAVILLQYGHTADAGRLIDAELAHDTAGADSIRRNMRPLYTALDGWRLIQQGDTGGGLRRMETGLGADRTQSIVLNQPPRFAYALALAARPVTRDRGMAFLRYGFPPQVGILYPSTFLALGRTAEAAGDRALARDAYARFIRYWDKADPDLQPRVTEAREAIRRLSRETPTAP
jgi:serine/threonine-protein kinase